MDAGSIPAASTIDFYVNTRLHCGVFVSVPRALIFVVLFSALFASGGIGQDLSGHYKLGENEFLFVEGEEQRELWVQLADDVLIVNDKMIRARSKVRKEPKLGGALGRRDTLYSQVPMIADFVEKGGSREEAVQKYHETFDRFRHWFFQELDLAKSVGSTPDDFQRVVDAKLKTQEFSGCFKFVEVVELDEIRWQAASSPEIRNMLVSCSSLPEVDLKKAAEYYLGCFGNSAPVELVIISSGNFAHLSGGDVPQIVSQLRAIEATGQYQKGPFDLRTLRALGFKRIQ